MLLLATLTPHICLINNLRLDQLFNDILKCDEPNGLIERISLSLRVDTMHKSHVAFYAWNKPGKSHSYKDWKYIWIWKEIFQF